MPAAPASPLLSAIRAALLGHAVGDALGVPVEFSQRATRQANPVTGMLGYGTHHQPPGTWSDDASLTFCLAESLAAHPELDEEDLAERLTQWLEAGYWAAHGKAFDVGIATRQALGRLLRGDAPASAGGTGEQDNGNGALMRLLPLVFHQTFQPALPATPADLAAQLTLTHRAARLTHGHPRSSLGCWLYLTVARHLLAGAAPAEAYAAMRTDAATLLSRAEPPFAVEAAAYEAVLNGALPGLTERHVHSSGYVVHTLEAALWCLLTETTYAATVLKAVNLGDDTDTTAAVAGGLAGLAYGEAAIPAEWRAGLVRRGEIEALAGRLAAGLAADVPARG